MFILDSGCPHPIAELFAYSICLTPALFDLQLVPFGSIVFNVLIILTTLMSAEFLNNKFRKFPLYTSPGKDFGDKFCVQTIYCSIADNNPLCCHGSRSICYLDPFIHEQSRDRQRAIFIALILDLQNIVFIRNFMCIIQIT